MKSISKKSIIIYGIYIIIGIALCVVGFFSEKNFLSSFGAAFAAVGIAKTVQYARLLKNPEKLKKWTIMQNDERNIAIALKARSITFRIIGLASGIAIIICYLINQELVGMVIAYTLCAMLVIYILCYHILNLKM